MYLLKKVGSTLGTVVYSVCDACTPDPTASGPTDRLGWLAHPGWDGMLPFIFTFPFKFLHRYSLLPFSILHSPCMHRYLDSVVCSI